MALASRGGITDAHRCNFDFSSDNWRELVQECVGIGGEAYHGDLKRKRHHPSSELMHAPGGGCDAVDGMQVARSGWTQQWRADRCPEQIIGGWSSFNAVSSAPAAEAAVEQPAPQLLTVQDYRCEMVRLAKGVDREATLLKMERAGIVPDARDIDLVLSGYICYKDRARVLECRQASVTSNMLVVMLSSKDVSSHVEDAVKFTSSLSDDLLCNVGVLVKLIPICADAQDEDILMRLWALGQNHLPLWPDKLKRSINKCRHSIKETCAWQLLMGLLGFQESITKSDESSICVPSHENLRQPYSIGSSVLDTSSGKGWGTMAVKSSSKGWGKHASA
jgi:hypothetical protein